MSNEYITKGELDEFVKLFPNAYDRAYCYLLYEGFTPEQILSIKPEDIGDGFVKICGGKVLQVSGEAIGYLLAADRQQQYFVYNHLCDGLIGKELSPSPYVIRFPRSAEDGGEVKSEELELATRHQRMQRRLYKTQRLHGNTTKFTEKGLYYSGMVVALEGLARKYDGDIERAWEADREGFLKIAGRWNQTKWRACIVYRRYMGT